ncbi:putative carboxy-terminal processing protease precursor [Streptomyces sp. Tu6071]|nr:putative carboxy-terminal processing protease precursor [Streptomyces sp. Tu6071]
MPRPRAGQGFPLAAPLLLAAVLAAGLRGGWLPSYEAQQTRAPEGASAVSGARLDGAVRSALARGRSGTEAARALVSRSGHRWDAVYGPSAYAAWSEGLTGAYAGVGLALAHDADGVLRVSRVRPGAPAARAGVRTGERLLSVGGREVAGLPVTRTVGLLRGGPGTRVAVRLVRDDGTERRLVLTRVRLGDGPVVSVERYGDGGARVLVRAFTRGAGERVRAAVAALPPRTAVVLDLRGNPGGLLDEAARAAGAFLDGGVVATYEDGGSRRVLGAPRGAAGTGPLVVLVDGGTASAAEVVTGALQDRGRAVVVGEPTFGKGTVQVPRALPDGSVAELTVGRWRTPAGRGVEGEGLAPDVSAAPGTAEARAREVLTGLGTPS